MKPFQLAVAAFVAGLIPGLALYWTSAQRSTQPQSGVPAAQIAAPVPPVPSVPPAGPVVVEKKSQEKPAVQHAAPTPQNIALLEQQLQDRAERLASAEASLNETKSRVSELESKIATLTEQSTQAQASEKTVRQELDAAARQIAALQSDLVKAREKAAEVDAAQLRTLKQTAESAQKSATRTAELANELEEIARRRETYLNQILSRYREATDLFRAMSVRMDNPRDAGSPLNNDLSRIQQAVQHAEEDLRQLRALNQGSTRVMKELSTVRAKR